TVWRVVSDSTRLPPVHEAWLPREHALHRPRHGGRQLAALISALVFFVTPTALWVVGLRPTEIENHKLASFPSITDGWGMFTKLPRWAIDQLVFRGAAIDAADGISRGIFGEPPPFGTQRQPTGPLPGSTPPATDESPDVATGYRQVIEGEDGWLYLGDDVRGKCHPRKPLNRTIAGLNKLRKAVEASGREFRLIVAPDKTTMVPEHLPDRYAGKDCAEAFTRKLWPRLIEEAEAIDDDVGGEPAAGPDARLAGGAGRRLHVVGRSAEDDRPQGVEDVHQLLGHAGRADEPHHRARPGHRPAGAAPTARGARHDHGADAGLR